MIVAIDNSMSMQAGDRWEKSKNWALDQLATLNPGDEAGLLLMNPSPTWLVPITDDFSRVHAALQEVRPGYEATRYEPALRMAGEALLAYPAGAKTIVWMGDEQQSGWVGTAFKQPLPPGVKILFGETEPLPKRQAAILAAHWLAETGTTALEASVRLFAPDRDKRHLSVQAGGQTLADQEVELIRGVETRIRIPLKLPQGQIPDGVRITLDADDLPAGGTVWLADLPGASTPVLFQPVASGADYLSDALQSTQKLTDSALEAKPVSKGDWPPASVAILRDSACFTPPLSAQLERFIATGGALWIFVDGSPRQTAWLKQQGIQATAKPEDQIPWHLCDWDPQHPILAGFADQGILPLMEIEFNRGFNLEGDSLSPVAKWPDGSTAIAEFNSQGHHLFLCGFPLDRAATDWLVRPSFVPFVHQTVRWLALQTNVRSEWHVGDTIPLPSPQGSWRAIDSPRPEPPRNVTGSVRPTLPGLFEYSDGKQRRVFAVNVPPSECDLSPWQDRGQLLALESSKPAVPDWSAHRAALPLSDEVAESQQRLWWWLLAFCGAGMLAELALANRTTI
jgi:hypothetical protein